MIRPIVRDVIFLSQKSVPASKQDVQTALDLMDTLRQHQKECVGMAANMIGVKKNIIAISAGIMPMVMINPQILKKSGPYDTKEGCLCLAGTRSTTRYKNIELAYQDLNFVQHHQSFSGFTAQIIQHECDHLKGIVI